MAHDDPVAVIERVTAALPMSEDRPGQREMARAVGDAIGEGRHLVVQAPTGVGKSLGYLVPAILSGQKVVVTTATKALQDQLATKDLPFLADHLAELDDHDFDFAVLKGRSNYVCLQRLREMSSTEGGQLELEELAPTTKLEVRRIADWVATTATGDQSELDWAPTDRAWQSVSVSSDECPGAQRCPLGSSCFAEAARDRANAADIVVVNTHLYGLDVGSGGMILPDHDVVVIDEAHQLEDIMSDTVGVSIGAGRFTRVAAALRRIIEEPTIVAGVADTAVAVREVLAPHLGNRLGPALPDPIAGALSDGRRQLDAALGALRAISTEVDDAKQRVLRAQQLAGRLVEHIDQALAYGEQYVAFVGGGPEVPRLEIAPLDVGPVLRAGVWEKRTAILTSATIPLALSRRVGLPAERVDELSVESPFEYETHALLYCALHLPDPRNAAFAPASHEELEALITAAGGRTLALFTSYRAMDAAAEALKAKLPFTVYTQRDLPKPALIDAFSRDEESCLFATSGFFQGVDIPGRTLSLVTIDRIPFPRPDDPLLSARREQLGPAAFSTIDLPRAAMLLSQATGRLIRSRVDRGVVAVLDRRLGTAGYRWDIVRALPPMRRTRHRADAEAFLREITR
jgi:ATP-dependent DNA helicase DinG